METPSRIELVGGEVLILEWADGTVSELTARALREACACADCRAKDDRPPAALRLQAPMVAAIVDAHLVGSYGINLTFAPDNHRTGIFTFDQLRDLAGTLGTST
jgi:DUF971 family protein